jgi:hypothetical protein
MTRFLESSDSLQTDQAILDAIWKLSGENETMAMNFWQEPNARLICHIAEIVTKNGMIDSKEFCWGACGKNWEIELSGCI